MRSNQIPSYLFTSSHGIYYFRVRVPKKIRIHYNTHVKEIRKSLGTRDRSDALKHSRRLMVMMELTDYTMVNIDEKLTEENEGKKLLRRLLIEHSKAPKDDYFRDFDRESTLECFVNGLSSEEVRLLNLQLEKWNELPKSKRKNIIGRLNNGLGRGELKASGCENKPTVTDGLVSSKIDEYLSRYFEKNIRSGRALPAGTQDEYRGIYSEFLSIIGNDLKCGDLDKQVLKKYEEALWHIPANHSRKTKYKKKSIPEILSMVVLEDEKRAPATLNKHIMRVKQFLKWAGREEYIKSRLDEYLESVLDKVSANQKRDIFTDDELILLFHSDVYEKGRFKTPSRYWLPLLALFTGARGEELAQLFSDDVVCDKDTSIYCLHIRENKGRKQHLKNPSATRIVPLHDRLIRLGFLEFVDNCKSKSLLFPELDKEDGRRFKKFGNNFNRKSDSGWKWKSGVIREKTSFHSFRHNVVDFLAKSNVNERISCAIVGHSFKGDGLIANYIKPAQFKELQKGINTLKFSSIDWRKIPTQKW